MKGQERGKPIHIPREDKGVSGMRYLETYRLNFWCGSRRWLQTGYLFSCDGPLITPPNVVVSSGLGVPRDRR